MLLSGIYYGKTRIGRAYKNGEIIWSIGTDKYINDVGVDIKSDVVAYVTAGALKILQLEEDVRVYHSALINTSPIKPGEIVEPVTSEVNSILDVNDASLVFVETGANIEKSAVVHTSPVSYGAIDLDTSVYDASTITIDSSANYVIDAATIWNVVAESVIDSSRHGVAEKTLLLDQDALLNFTQSDNSSAYETTVLTVDAKSHIDQARNGLTENDIAIQSETDLNCLVSREELANETLLLQKDSVLNMSHGTNGVVDETIILNITAEPTINKSDNNLIEDTAISTETNLNCLSSANGLVEETLEFKTDSTLSAPSSVTHVIGETVNLNIIAEPLIIDSDKNLTDKIAMSIGADLNSSASDNAVVEEALILTKDSILSVADSANVSAHETTMLLIAAEPSVNRACDELVEHDVILQTETDLSCLPGGNEVQDVVALDTDALLNTAHSANGIVLDNLTMPIDAEIYYVNSANVLTQEILNFKVDAPVHVLSSVNSVVNETIDYNIVAEPTMSNAARDLIEDIAISMETDLVCASSEQGIVKEAVVLKKDSVLSVMNSANGLAHVITVLDAMAESSVDQARNGLARPKITLQIETDLNCLPVGNEFTSALVLEKDSILNIAQSINGSVIQIATLHNLTQGDVVASVEAIIKALNLVDPNVYCSVSAASKGIIDDNLSLGIDVLGAVSPVESGVIDNATLLKDVVKTQVSPSTYYSVSHIVSETTQSVVNTTGVNDMKIYNTFLRFEDDKFIQISETDKLCSNLIVSLLQGEPKLNISNKKPISEFGVDTQVTSDAKILFGALFEIALNEGSTITSNNVVGFVLPFDLMAGSELRSGSDAILNYTEPYDAYITQAIQSNNINTVTFWRPFELCLGSSTRSDLTANLAYQNTIAARLDGCLATEADAHLMVGTHTNFAECNAKEKMSSSASLSFWQLPIQQGSNLLIRQAWGTEPYSGDGSLIIY